MISVLLGKTKRKTNELHTWPPVTSTNHSFSFAFCQVWEPVGLGRGWGGGEGAGQRSGKKAIRGAPGLCGVNSDDWGFALGYDSVTLTMRKMLP